MKFVICKQFIAFLDIGWALKNLFIFRVIIYSYIWVYRSFKVVILIILVSLKWIFIPTNEWNLRCTNWEMCEINCNLIWSKRKATREKWYVSFNISYVIKSYIGFQLFFLCGISWENIITLQGRLFLIYCFSKWENDEENIPPQDFFKNMKRNQCIIHSD